MPVSQHILHCERQPVYPRTGLPLQDRNPV